MASHGLGGLEFPDGIDVMLGLIQEMGADASWAFELLCAPADWEVDVKCDGGISSFWVLPEDIKQKNLHKFTSLTTSSFYT